jgi:glycosyltransferase involved in cell wall biosynthesis
MPSRNAAVARDPAARFRATSLPSWELALPFFNSVNFSIVTPSFRNSKWLQLCIPSVADQEGVTFEHIVQDSCSDDGTQDWLPRDRRVRAYIEKDEGMYDAVNRGYRRSQGEILAYLNCDEQYLPGALKAVNDFFEGHPDVDVVFADTVVTDANGDYICHRPSLTPLEHHMWYCAVALTCALFVRRRVVTERGLFFDSRWRDIADMFWLQELAKRNVKMGVLRRFTSVFADTGENMNLKPNARREKAIQTEMVPKWVRRIAPMIRFHHRLRMLASGTYFQRPFDYSLFTFASPARRVTCHVAKPTAIWRGRR